jgi:hypothetical protein
MKFSPDFNYKSINELLAGHIAVDPSNAASEVSIVGGSRASYQLVTLHATGAPTWVPLENVVSVVQYRGETVVEVLLLGARNITSADLANIEDAFVVLEAEDRYLPFIGPSETGLINLKTGEMQSQHIRAGVALPAFRVGVKDEDARSVLQWVFTSRAYKELVLDID